MIWCKVPLNERLVLGADLLLQKETLDEQALKNL